MSEIRKIKVLSVEFEDQYQPEGKSFIIYYFQLKTDAEEIARFSTNGRNQTKFLIGETYEVSVTEKNSKSGIKTFFDYSDAEKERRKAGSGSSSTGGGQKKGGVWQPYVRPRKEIVSIISQSSYEAALLACVKLNPLINSHLQIKSVSKIFAEFIMKESGLNSTECMNGISDALKEANNKSIVLQSALKRAVESLNFTASAEEGKGMEKELGGSIKTRSTQGIISLAELIVKDINEIANGL
jgi:hypothetical protein